jgi:hypothetical protein
MDRGSTNKFPHTVAVKPGGGGDPLKTAPTAPSKHICSKCNGQFSSKRALIHHFHVQHLETKSEKIIPCPHSGCEAKFEKQSFLKKHIKNAHVKATLKCHSCPGLYRTKGQLNVHIMRVHDKVQYKCKYCNMSFNHHRLLQVQVFIRF